MRTKLTVSGVVLLLILLSAGWSAWRSPALVPDPQELRLVVQALPGTLDWSHSSSPSDVNFPVLLAIMRGLTRLDGHGRVQPDLASAWETELTPGPAPRMILTFHLAEVLWSDGRTPLEARDFVYAWRRAALGVDRGELEQVQGMAELNRARDLDPGLAPERLRQLLAGLGVEALDPRTLRVTLVAPRSEFLQLLAQVYVFYPAPSRELEGLPEPAVRAYFDQPRDGRPLVLGPYRPQRWDRLRGLIELVRNPQAPADPQAPLRVVFHQSALEAVLFAHGKADMLQIQDPRDLWAPTPGMLRQPLLSTVWLGFDTARVPLALRQALAWGLDRERLLAGVLPRARIAFGLLPHDLDLEGGVAPGDPLGRGFPRFDPARARRLLAQSGVDRRLRLQLLVPKDALMPAEALARGIQQQLGEYGLDVEIVASSQFRQDLETLRPHLFIRRTGADYHHEHTFFIPQTRSGSNGARWKDLDGGRPMAELEELLAQASAQADPERRRQLYSRAQEDLLARWTVLVPLYHPDRVFRVQPWVRGLTFDPFNNLDLRAVALGRR